MKVFDKPFVVTKQEDDSFLVSVALSDSSVVVKVVARRDLEQLLVDLEEALKE